jgi:hypothetical protein
LFIRFLKDYDSDDEDSWVAVHVNTMDGNTLELKVPAAATTSQMKRLIKEKTGINMSAQKLFRG